MTDNEKSEIRLECEKEAILWSNDLQHVIDLCKERLINGTEGESQGAYIWFQEAHDVLFSKEFVQSMKNRIDIINKILAESQGKIYITPDANTKTSLN